MDLDVNNAQIFALLQQMDSKLDAINNRTRSLELWRSYVIGAFAAAIFITSIIIALR